MNFQHYFRHQWKTHSLLLNELGFIFFLNTIFNVFIYSGINEKCLKFIINMYKDIKSKVQFGQRLS